jgi:hypothetical protein
MVVGWDLTDGTRLVNYTNPGAAAAEAEAFAEAAGESAGEAAEAEEAIRGIVYHGWVSGLTAVYVSATSIKIEGLDVTDRIQQGTKIRYKQGVEYKYDFVSEVSFATDSTLTLMGGSTVEDLPITDFAYSNIANSIGWPFGADYIEGENDNGNWKMRVDGTLECWGEQVYVADVNAVGAGSVFRNGGSSFNVNWPCEFQDPPIENLTLVSSAPFSWIGSTGVAPTTIKSSRISLMSATSYASGAEFCVHFYAIGRWRA